MLKNRLSFWRYTVKIHLHCSLGTFLHSCSVTFVHSCFGSFLERNWKNFFTFQLFDLISRKNIYLHS